jgi:hypothetical protein
MEEREKKPSRVFKHERPVKDNKRAWFYINEMIRNQGSFCRYAEKEWKIIYTGDLELVKEYEVGCPSTIMLWGPFVGRCITKGEEWKINEVMKTMRKGQPEVAVTDSEVKSMREWLKQRLRLVGSIRGRRENTHQNQPKDGMSNSLSMDQPESSASNVSVEKLKEFWLKQQGISKQEEQIGIPSGTMDCPF